MKKIACLMALLLLVGFSGCQRTVWPSESSTEISYMTDVPVQGPSATEDTSGTEPPQTAEPVSLPDPRMHLRSYVDGEYPEETVIVSVRPSEAVYLEGGEGGYIPEDQEAWKAAIRRGTALIRRSSRTRQPISDAMRLILKIQ